MTDPLRVLVFGPLYPPAFRGGGPIRSLEAFVATAPRGMRLHLVTGDRDLGADERLPVPRNIWIRDGAAFVRHVDRRDPIAILRAAASVGPVDVVYVNGCFDRSFAMLARAWSRSRGLPTVVAPHGELDPGALAIHTRRKRAFLAATAAIGLDRGVLWHASSPREAHDIRAAVGASAQVVVSENPHGLPPLADRRASSGGPLRIAYVSRITPKKRLHALLEALAQVQADWRLDIVGTEEDAAYVARCRALATAPGMRDRVRFVGAVQPASVHEVFAEHDLFALPTAGENFGHVIAESLAASCPVLLPDTTPWTRRVDDGGGEIVPSLDAEAWATTIEAWARLDADARTARRDAAADVYESWRAQSAPHLLELVRARLRPRDS